MRVARRRRLRPVAALLIAVAIGVAAAAVIYVSNEKSGTWTTGEGLSISGFAIPTTIDIETQTDIAGNVANGLGRNMTGITVTWNITRTGLVAADLDVSMAHDHVAWVAVTPISCGTDCMSFVSAPFDLTALSNVAFDLRITVHEPGSYTWTVVATGSA